MTRSRRMPIARLALAFALTLGGMGCIQVPELDEAGDPALDTADFPELIPLGPVVAASADPSEASADLQADLQGRAARLQRQAEALRNSEVLDPAARARLQQGLDR